MEKAIFKRSKAEDVDENAPVLDTRTARPPQKKNILLLYGLLRLISILLRNVLARWQGDLVKILLSDWGMEMQKERMRKIAEREKESADTLFQGAMDVLHEQVQPRSHDGLKTDSALLP